MYRTRNNQSNKLFLVIGITVLLVIAIGGVTIYLIKKTGNKKTETTPWYVTLRTSYWYDNDDYDATTRSRLPTLSWYTSEIESDNDLDDLLDEWSITTRTSTSTTTTTTRVMTTTTTTPFSPDDYFFYGLNHSTLINGTDSKSYTSYSFNMSSNVTFFNRSYNSINIFSHGFVKFSLNLFNGLTIYPFFSYFDTSKKHDIYYGEIRDEKMLQSIGADVRKLCKYDGFMPTWAYVITWDNVRPLTVSFSEFFIVHQSNYTNTFQLLLTSNGNESFAMLNFVRMDWPNENIRKYFSSSYYNYCFDSRSSHYRQYVIEEKSVRNLTDKSNMGRPGRWFIAFNNTNCPNFP